MKTKFTLVAAVIMLACSGLMAQMANGSPAPDWTVTDLNGNTHTLSSVLASGKAVGLKFSATWCGPCWTYHNTHQMRDAYDTWGPAGTDQVEMYYMEASPTTNEACLYGPSGCVGGTQGDWVTGTTYNVVHLTGANQNLANQYQVPGYPTLYAVSPDQRVYWIGNWGGATANVWGSWLIESFSLEATATVTDADCGDGAIDLDPTGGFGVLNYSWSNGANTEDVSGLAPGTYTVTISDSHNYDIERTFTVGAPAAGPFVIELLTLTDVTCFDLGDGFIEVLASGGSGSGYDYQWSNGMTGTFIDGLNGDDYQLTVTDGTGCEITESYFVYEPIAIEATSQTVPQSCGDANGSISIDATGGEWPYSYELDDGTTNTNGNFGGLVAGIYDVRVLDGNQCEKVYPITVDEVPEPEAQTSTSNDLNCAIVTSTVSGMGSTGGSGITYQWTTADGNIVSGADQIEAVVDAPGEYMLEVLDSNFGCLATSATVVLADLETPMIAVSDDADLTCTVTSIELCATVDAANTVTWMLPSGAVAQNCVTVTAADTYMAEVMAPNGCTASAEVTVGLSDDQPQVEVPTPATLTCAQPSTTLVSTVVGNPADYTWQWTTTDGAIDGAGDTPEVQVTGAGTYTLVVSNIASGCQSSQNVTVESDAALPSPSFTYTLVDGVLRLVNTSGTTQGLSWDLGNGETAVESEVTITYPANGTYEVCVTVSNDCGPADVCQMIEYVVALRAVPTTLDVLCFGDADGEASVNAQGGLPPYTVTWTAPDGSTLSGESIAGLAPGMYDYVLDDDFGYQQVGSVVIQEPTDIVVESSVVTDETAPGANDGTIEIDAKGGVGSLSYLWSNGATVASISDLAPGQYSCIISDENGCERGSEVFDVAAAPVSAFDIEGLLDLQIYPSPARDRVVVQLSLDRYLDVAVALLDMSGREIMIQRVSGDKISTALDLTDRPAGLYLVQIQTEHGVQTEKIIKIDN